MTTWLRIESSILQSVNNNDPMPPMGAVLADQENVSDAVSAQQWLARFGSLEAAQFIERASALIEDLAGRPRSELAQLAVLETVRAPLIDAMFRSLFRDVRSAAPHTRKAYP